MKENGTWIRWKDMAVIFGEIEENMNDILKVEKCAEMDLFIGQIKKNIQVEKIRRVL